MSKSLRKSLNLDLTDLAEMLRSKGRGKDTVLAHITPKEAALLKSRGGRGSRNPDTGLLEFENEFDYGSSFDSSATPVDTAPADAGGGAVTADNGVTQTDTSITSPFSYAQPGDANAPQYLPGSGDESVQSANIDTSQTGEGGFAPGAQAPAPKSLGDYASGLYDKLFGTGGDTTGGGGLSSLMKLLGPAAVAALGAKTGSAAAQQGQAAANQVGALSPAVQARANAATQTMTGQLAPAAIQFGQQYGGQVADVQNQLQGVAGNIAAYGAPLINIGQNQMTQALSGGLTPAGQRAYEAQKAQAEQNVASRGGVGAMQAGRAEMDALANLAQQQFQQGQATYQAGAQYGVQGQSLLAQAAQLGLNSAQVQLAQNNLANTIQQNAINLSLSQAGISDQYLIQSIQMGLASDQQTAANLQGLYSKMAQIAFSQPTTTTTTTRATT